MDTKTIITSLKEASPFDIFLVSFLILPFVLDAWVSLLSELGVEGSSRDWSLVAVVVAYVLGVAAVFVGNSRVKKRKEACNLVLNYLQTKNFFMMSFERIRDNIDPKYTDELLNSLPLAFPNEIRKARLRGGKQGLARIIEEDDEVPLKVSDTEQTQPVKGSYTITHEQLGILKTNGVLSSSVLEKLNSNSEKAPFVLNVHYQLGSEVLEIVTAELAITENNELERALQDIMATYEEG
jgi:hypothetical protein